MERRDLNLAKGMLTVRESKTEAGMRTVVLTPALRDELATYLDRSKWKEPTDLVFPTQTGKRDNRNNVRERLFRKAVEVANVKLADLGIGPIAENLAPHGLRRTYASLRHYVGDDVAWTAAQLGHTDAGFTLGVYTQGVRRRHELSDAERVELDKAVEWASWPAESALIGTSGSQSPAPLSLAETRNSR
ncbi:MAG: site-specific integrase [Actinomycetota bacterium]